MARKRKLDPIELFDELVYEGLAQVKTNHVIGIVEFAEQYLLAPGDTLFPPQRAILRALYNEPLPGDELAILQRWAEQDVTTWVPDRSYVNMVLECGRRGGKSVLASICVLYEFYCLINLDNPAKHYGLLSGSPIAIFVIARSGAQVNETLFGAIRGYASQSAYFKGLVNSGQIEILTQEIRCQTKNIAIYAKHTNSQSLVGYSLKMLVLDEAARFEYNELGESKADDIWSNVAKGLSTFGDKGKKIAISSAWGEGDYIQNLYKVATRDARMVAFRLRTWDINLRPEVSEYNLKNSEDYIRDPVTAALEYEGIRSSRHGSFFQKEYIEEAVKGLSCLDARSIPLDITNGDDTRHYVSLQITRLERLNGGHSYLHVDYGLKKDSAAIALVRSTKLEDGRWGVIVDGLLVWKPYSDRDDRGRGIQRIVSYLDIEEKLVQICQARRISLCSFDSYQSQSTIQRLHAHGIRSTEMSTTNTAQLSYYNLTRQLLNEGRLILPRDSTWTHSLMAEMGGILQLASGKITHNERASGKDIIDAVVNAVFNCVKEDSTLMGFSVSSSGIKSISSKTLKKNRELTTARGKGLLLAARKRRPSI